MDRKKKDSIAVTSPSGLSQRSSDYREHSNSRIKDPVGAALQSIESDINIASLDDNVKGYLQKIIGDGMMMDRKKKDSIAVTSHSGLSQRSSDYREHSNSRTKDPVGAALQSIESDINIASLDDNVK